MTSLTQRDVDALIAAYGARIVVGPTFVQRLSMRGWVVEGYSPAFTARVQKAA